MRFRNSLFTENHVIIITNKQKLLSVFSAISMICRNSIKTENFTAVCDVEKR